MFLRQVGVGAAGVGLLSFVSGCGTTRQAAGADKLPRSTPEAEGVSSAGILAFLARIIHRGIEQRSGERVRRLEITQPNEHATHRFFDDRL